MQVRLAQAQRLLDIGRRVVGLEPLDEVHRAFVERAAGGAVGVALDAAVGGIAGVGRHAAELEGAGVDPRAVAVAIGQEDRTVRHDGVEVLAAGRAAREVVHVPAAAPDPRLVRMACGVLGDDREVGLAPAGAVELAAQAGEAAVHRVDVGILEPGRDGPAAKLDDARRRTDVARELTVRAGGHDPPAADSERAHPASCGIHGGDASAAQDEIGGLVGRLGHHRLRIDGIDRPSLPAALPTRPRIPSAATRGGAVGTGHTLRRDDLRPPAPRRLCR